MTMKRGDCGPRSSLGARLAAVDSLAAIFREAATEPRLMSWIIAEWRELRMGRPRILAGLLRGRKKAGAGLPDSKGAVMACRKCEKVFTSRASTGVLKRANGGASGGYQ
jgi:hypothetical protein